MRLPSLILLACAALVGCAIRVPAPAPVDLLIRNVTVVDPGSGELLESRDVAVSDGRIRAITASGGHAPPAARVIEGRDRYLMPGLWDMHAHWYDEASLPVFLAHGVTGIRQMRGYTGMYAMRARGVEGTVRSPRVYLASPLVDGPRSATPPALRAADADSARALVRLIARSSADFLKLYDQVPSDAYLALLDEARQHGVRVEGHVPVAVSWQEAAELGVQRSFEHLHSLPIWTASDADALHRRWLAYHERLHYNSGIDAAHRLENARIHTLAYDSQEPAAQAALFRTLAESRVWQVPTCILWRARGAAPGAFEDDPRMRLIPAWMRGFWASWWPDDAPEAVARDFALNARRDAYCLQMVKRMHAAGVPLLAGSDTIMPGVFPGSSLHEELALMVEAGLSPLDALRTATAGPAAFMQRDDVGRIAVGALADLVLLKGNPLHDITNSARIAGVGIGGEWLDEPALEAVMTRVAALAKRPSVAEGMAQVLATAGLDAALRHYEARCPAPPEEADCAGLDVGWQVTAALTQPTDAAREAEFLAWFENRMQADADALWWLADRLAGRGDAQGALRVVARVLELAPGDPMTLDLESSLHDAKAR